MKKLLALIGIVVLAGFSPQARAAVKTATVGRTTVSRPQPHGVPTTGAAGYVASVQAAMMNGDCAANRRPLTAAEVAKITAYYNSHQGGGFVSGGTFVPRIAGWSGSLPDAAVDFAPTAPPNAPTDGAVWAPDGNGLSLVVKTNSARQAEIWLRTKGVSVDRKLVVGTSPCWSPDSASFIYQPPAADRIAVFDIAKRTAKAYTIPPGGQTGVYGWSPDGQVFLNAPTGETLLTVPVSPVALAGK